MAFFISWPSRLSSALIFWARSPFATAVVTSAMLRTWSVRLPAIMFTLSVRSFHVPATPPTSAWPPSFPSVPTSLATRVLGREAVELVHHRIDGVLECQDLAFDLHGDLARQVALGHRGGHLRDVAHLAREIRGHRVHGVGQILPGTRDAAHLCLAAELALGAYLT